MRTYHRISLGLVAALGAFGCGASAEDGNGDLGQAAQAVEADLPVIAPTFVTPPTYGYDDAPRAPDSDDPAIWVNARNRGQGLFIGALKDAGLQVYDLKGRVVQTIAPPNRRPVSAEDPRVPGPQPDPGTTACPESEGDTFGRFNNVDVQYGFVVFDKKRGLRKIDVAVVTDRGCDRVRTYEIDPSRSGGPLFEITASSAPRVFPKRLVQPSPYQSPGESTRVEANPVDDQSTAYGLTLYRTPFGLHAFVTQRSRAVVAELALVPQLDGTVSYVKVREFRFPATFDVKANQKTVKWTPCREDPTEDPQLEGLVVDQEKGILYASQEVIGVWEIPLNPFSPSVVNVPPGALMEKTRSFGAPYVAVPDDDEYSCEAPDTDLSEGAVAAPGVEGAGGEFLNADVEGLAIYYTGPNVRRDGYLLVSSQGDDTFHVFERTRRRTVSGGLLTETHRHLHTFEIESTGETDGHDVVNVPMGPDFPSGLFVVQNGKAPEPADPGDVNGYEFDNATQFELVGWDDIAAPLGLDVDTRSYDPRR